MKTHRYLTNFVTVSILVAAAGASSAADWPQWRGPNRDGISRETGLLKEWPQAGPKMLWKATDMGSGYATPSVVGERLYLLGNEGLENEFVSAVAVKDGRRIWRARVGNVGQPKQQPNFPAARSTPTVVGEALYALGSDGDLVCLETGGGAVKWRKNLRADFGGKFGTWAYAESPLVDGEAVICTPGGPQATMIALNRHTGEVLWQCAIPEAGDAAYASALAIEAAGVKQYVQLTQKGLVGVEAKSGKFLWRYGKPTSAFDANIPTPVFGDGCVFAGSAGTGGGTVKLKANAGGIEAEPLYFSAKLPTAIGGAVKLGNYLYGTTAQTLECVEFTTGKVQWDDRAQGAASLCFADGRLYAHGENGDVALIEPSPEKYRETGRFTPPNQPKRLNPMEKAWAYPVVAGGRLFLRDHGSLWSYDIRTSATAR